jgi:radical SAM superfamily enzyme YgiQ (UPF0313 family)
LNPPPPAAGRAIMKKNLLLVNPWICDFAAFDLWAKPLGLLIISNILKSLGIGISVIDTMDRHHPAMLDHPGKDRTHGTGKYFSQKIEKPEVLKDVPRHYQRYGMPPEVFQACLNSEKKPDAVIMTSQMTYWYPGVFECIRILKQQWPGTPVILGGNYARLLPEHARTLSGADHVYSGIDMEETIILAGKVLGLELNAAEFKDFKNWPVPDFSGYRQPGYFVLSTSLGCPFRCDYCSTPVFYPHFCQNDPENVCDQIASLHQMTGVTDLAFYDDALLVKASSHLVPLLKGLKERGLNLSIHAPNGLHPRFITPEIADLMRQSGFRSLRLSLESSNDQLLKKSDNKISCDEFVQAVKNLQEAGYKQSDLKTYILLGVPGQKPQDVMDTADWVFEAGAVPVLTEYSIIPGSKDWNTQAVSRGWDRMDPLLHNNSLFSVMSGWWDWESEDRFKQKVKRRTASLQASS